MKRMKPAVSSATRRLTMQCVGCKAKRAMEPDDEKTAHALGCAFCRRCGLPMLLHSVALIREAPARKRRKG